MRFVFAEPEMSDAIRCEHFADTFPQRKFIR